VPAPAENVLAARVLGDLAAVTAAGHWNRIKACANEACGALFYDTTKARTRRWHSFGQCGNKANVAAHRQRQASAD
jgi:predicted RNA-binding Zn ribbon-like protein